MIVFEMIRKSNLQRKIAIVTGWAAQGIGRSIELELAAQRANLLVTDIQEHKVSGVAKEIKNPNKENPWPY
jgi:NAD(P)-dependent dehydrogenase (short-subunit alcohol dehydrogenase family)